MLEVKGAMLLSAATRMRFEILPNRDGFVLHYSAPSDQLMASDLQTTYSAAQDTYGARQVDRNYQWPANVFLSIVEDNLVEGRMTDEDVEHARQLHNQLNSYIPILGRARTQFETFLRSNFSLEDLFYVRRKR